EMLDARKALEAGAPSEEVEWVPPLEGVDLGEGPTIPEIEADAVRARWETQPNDLGLVVDDPTTGEIHVGNFDAHGGHELFLDHLYPGISDTSSWRGAIVSSDGTAINNSGLNVGRGFGQGMAPPEFQQVLDALRRAGLAN